MVVIDNLRKFTVEMVIKQGSIMASGGKLTTPIRSQRPHMKTSIRIRAVKRNNIQVKAKGDTVRVMELIPGQIATRERILEAPVRNGFVVSDTKRDILKILVMERHRKTGHRSFGLLKGLGLKSGALASTIAHDSHNIIAVGVDDEDIFRALLEIRRIHGGLVVVRHSKVIAELPLPLAGLISDRSLDFTAKKLREIEEAVRLLGVTLDHPFGVLSFLALPVLPALKLTDRGLVDVQTMRFVDLFV